MDRELPQFTFFMFSCFSSFLLFSAITWLLVTKENKKHVIVRKIQKTKNNDKQIIQ